MKLIVTPDFCNESKRLKHLLPFVQFKKPQKHQWMRDTFSKVEG